MTFDHHVTHPVTEMQSVAANAHAGDSFNQPEIKHDCLLPSSPTALKDSTLDSTSAMNESKEALVTYSRDTASCLDLASPESDSTEAPLDSRTVSDKKDCGAKVISCSSSQHGLMEYDEANTVQSSQAPSPHSSLSPSSCSGSPVSIAMSDVPKEQLALAPVSRACSNCKKSHLGCDFARPCKRCVNSGKQDSCHDVPKKIRARAVKAKADIVKEMLKQKTQLDEFAGRMTVARACNHCRKSHLRCDYSRPCQRCIVSGKADTCQDVENKRRKRQGEQNENNPKPSQTRPHRISDPSDTDEYRSMAFSSAPSTPGLNANQMVVMPSVSPYEYHPYSGYYPTRTATPVMTRYQQSYSPYHDIRTALPNPMQRPEDPMAYSYSRMQPHPYIPTIGFKREYSPDSPSSAAMEEAQMHRHIKRYAHISPASSPILDPVVLSTMASSHVPSMDMHSMKRLPPSPFEQPIRTHKKRNSSGFNLEDLLKK